jgi:hypothetical protein
MIEADEMECQVEVNKSKFSCTYKPCVRKGKCCECIRYYPGTW